MFVWRSHRAPAAVASTPLAGARSNRAKFTVPGGGGVLRMRMRMRAKECSWRPSGQKPENENKNAGHVCEFFRSWRTCSWARPFLLVQVENTNRIGSPQKTKQYQHFILHFRKYIRKLVVAVHQHDIVCVESDGTNGYAPQQYSASAHRNDTTRRRPCLSLIHDPTAPSLRPAPYLQLNGPHQNSKSTSPPSQRAEQKHTPFPRLETSA